MVACQWLLPFFPFYFFMKKNLFFVLLGVKGLVIAMWGSSGYDDFLLGFSPCLFFSPFVCFFFWTLVCVYPWFFSFISRVHLIYWPKILVKLIFSVHYSYLSLSASLVRNFCVWNCQNVWGVEFPGIFFFFCMIWWFWCLIVAS